MANFKPPAWCPECRAGERCPQSALRSQCEQVHASSSTPLIFRYLTAQNKLISDPGSLVISANKKAFSFPQFCNTETTKKCKWYLPHSSPGRSWPIQGKEGDSAPPETQIHCSQWMKTLRGRQTQAPWSVWSHPEQSRDLSHLIIPKASGAKDNTTESRVLFNSR